MALKAVSLLCAGQRQSPETAVKKEKEKPWLHGGLCRVTPQLYARDAGGVPHPRFGGGRAVGPGWWKKRGGSGGLAENKSLRLGAVTLCPNWFRQTKLHCPLTRTNKPSRERLKFTGDLKYLP